MTSHGSFLDWFDPKLLAALDGLDFQARYVMEGFLAGLHESPFHGFSVEFSEYRDYEPGDDLRHLDWRLYARTDRLYIKKYLQETNARFYVVCDTSGSMAYRGDAGWGSKLDCARILAAAMTWFLLRQNDAVGLIHLEAAGAVPQFIRASQKPSQLGVLLRQLESMQPLGSARLPELLAHAARLMHRRSVLLFFSDLLDPAESIAMAWKELRFLGHECIVFQVLDRDEIEFPFDRPRVFEDFETGGRRVVSPPSVRNKYLSRFRAFMAEYERLFRSLEMPHCVIQTDGNPCRALAQLLASRRRFG